MIITIKVITQRKQYCQSRFHPIVAILEAKNFKVEYDFLNFFQGLVGWNVIIICELWNYVHVSELKFDIEIPWSIFLTSR